MSKRNDILDTALLLFNRHGYQAVGVDLIRDRAQVSKMTLYKYFPTKDVLIEAVLALRHQRFTASLCACVEGTPNAGEQLQRLLAWHRRWFASAEFHGCMFIKAANEFGDAEALLELSRQHKQWLRNYLSGIFSAMGRTDAVQAAACTQALLDGALIDATLYREPAHAEALWQGLYRWLALPPPAPDTEACGADDFLA